MSPARMSIEGRVFHPLQRFVQHCVQLGDPVLDEIYFRLDFWSVPPTFSEDGCERLVVGEADYGKIRNFLLLAVVGFGYVMMILAMALWGLKVPAVVLVTVPIGIMAAAFGERVFIAFIKAWGSRSAHPEEAALAGLPDTASRVE